MPLPQVTNAWKLMNMPATGIDSKIAVFQSAYMTVAAHRPTLVLATTTARSVRSERAT